MKRITKQSILDVVSEYKNNNTDECELYFLNVCSKIQDVLDNIIKDYKSCRVLRNVSLAHYHDADISYNYLKDKIISYIKELGFETYQVTESINLRREKGFHIFISLDRIK